MNAVLALARKELLLLFRDKFSLFWILAFPLMFALFFGSIFGGSDGGGRGAISMAIVDEDGSDGSRALVAELRASEAVDVAAEREGEGGGGGDGGADGGAAAPASWTLEQAREAVQKGRRVAYLRIPAGYGDNPFAVFGGGPDRPVLEIGVDPGRRAEAGFLQGILMEAVFSAVQHRMFDKDLLRRDLQQARSDVAGSDLDTAKKVALQAFLGAVAVFADGFDLQSLSAGGGGGGMSPALRVVDVTRDRGNRPRSTFDISFPQALVWGLMSVAMSFAITLVRERSSGTLLRLRLAPIGRAQLLGGKALGCFLACMLTMTVLLGFGAVALGVRFDSVPLLFAAMVCTASCFTGLMMTISVLGRTESAVAGSSWGLMMPFAMIGGGMIPLIAMPDWLRAVSVVSPFKWAITAIEGAVWRGFGPGDMFVPCAVLVGIGALFFTIGVAVFRRVEG